ncbi:MAG: hypothetical protein FWE35_24740 [Streptosporangiales bacterium]|nr:hypothetical protein [Streptosporangiales bacterium]
MGRAKMGELRRAAEELGVGSTTLRQHGWRTASPARIQKTKENPPDWLIEARERRRKQRAQRQERRDREITAERLGIRPRVVKDRRIQPGQVSSLLSEPPDWLIAEQERWQAHLGREARDQLRCELLDSLLDSVEDAWFQELKCATNDAEIDAINKRGEAEVKQAKEEARRLVEELTKDQVRARIAREQDAVDQAAVYRARRLAGWRDENSED